MCSLHAEKIEHKEDLLLWITSELGSWPDAERQDGYLNPNLTHTSAGLKPFRIPSISLNVLEVVVLERCRDQTSLPEAKPTPSRSDLVDLSD